MPSGYGKFDYRCLGCNRIRKVKTRREDGRCSVCHKREAVEERMAAREEEMGTTSNKPIGLGEEVECPACGERMELREMGNHIKTHRRNQWTQI